MRRIVCCLLVVIFALSLGLVYAESGETETGGDYHVLSRGSKGEEVARLQERLNELGYSAGKADGSFGKKTKAAVMAFQALNDLPETGIADEDTQAVLFSEDAVQPTPTPVVTPKPTRTPRPTKTPKPAKKSGSSSSSYSGKLLSVSDCKELARFYLEMQVGKVTVQLMDATTDGYKCLVAIQYTKGFGANVAGVLIDMRDGSLMYIR